MLSRRAFLFAPAALTLGSAARAEEPFYISPNDVYRVEYKFRRREMAYKTTEPPGTIVVEPSKRFLYFIQPGGRAIRYGIGVGSSFKKWSGSATIVRMAKWPTWTPTKEMLARHKPYEKYKDGMPGGSDNPLGACR
jgi:lipoprotein-anchoring transpeptidase ErfK/SrfK